MTTERRNPQDPMIEEQGEPYPDQQQQKPQAGESQPRQAPPNENADRARDEYDAPPYDEKEYEPESDPEAAEFDDADIDEETVEAMTTGDNARKVDERGRGYGVRESGGPG